jgi:biotin carboxyl carrier protein
MKRKFKITIEGVSHEVEIEEIPGEAGSQIAASVSASPFVKPHVNKEGEHPASPPAAARAQAPNVAGKGAMSAPMPGTIVSIKVKVGDRVKVGDSLMVLEAMKMESDIPALQNGVIKKIFVSAGQNVRRMDPLLEIEE